MSSIVFQSKQAFIDALESRREFWQKYDRRAVEKHELAEQQWFEAYRLKLRQYLEMDFDQLKEARSVYVESAPKPPKQIEDQLDHLLQILLLTQSSKFTVSSDGGWKIAYQLLTQTEN